MVTFKVAAEIDGSVATNFRPGKIIHLQLVSFQQGENLKICHEIALVYLNDAKSHREYDFRFSGKKSRS